MNISSDSEDLDGLESTLSRPNSMGRRLGSAPRTASLKDLGDGEDDRPPFRLCLFAQAMILLKVRGLVQRSRNFSSTWAAVGRLFGSLLQLCCIDCQISSVNSRSLVSEGFVGRPPDITFRMTDASRVSS
jgi:hypothetical protein